MIISSTYKMGSINFNPVPMNFELVSFRVELGFEGENEKRLAFGASHEKVDNSSSGTISSEDGNQEDVATNDATKDDASSEMEDSNAIPATQNNDTTADEGNQANVSSNDATKEDTSEVKFSVFPSQEESLNNSTIPYEQQDPNVMTSDDGTIFIDMPGEEEDDYDDEDFCDIKFAASGSLVNRDGDLVAFAFSCVDQVLADMVGQAMDEAAPSEAGQNEEVPQDVTADLLQPVRYLMDNFGELLHHFNMQCL